MQKNFSSNREAFCIFVFYYLLLLLFGFLFFEAKRAPSEESKIMHKYVNRIKEYESVLLFSKNCETIKSKKAKTQPQTLPQIKP